MHGLEQAIRRPTRLPRACLFVIIAVCLAEPSAQAQIPLELSGCRYIEGIVQIPAAAVDALVPEPFDLFTQGGLASVSMGGADCASAASDEQQGSAAFGWLLVRINQPDDENLAGIGVRVWFYRLQHFVVPGDVYQSVAATAGVEQTPVDSIDVQLPAALGELSIRSSSATHSVQVPLSAPDGGLAAGQVRWREFHAVSGGYAMLEATLVPDLHAASLAGIIRPAPGSLSAEVLGEQAVGQALFGAAFAIRDARMAVLPA